MRAWSLARRHSEETRAKIGTSSPTALAVEVTDLETGTISEYPSVKKAADALGCSNTALLYTINKNTEKRIKEDIFLIKYKPL
jgi:hypothetical protein